MLKSRNGSNVAIGALTGAGMVTTGTSPGRTYGGSLRQDIADTKARGMMPIVLAPVPRNIWTAGKVGRCKDDHGKSAAEAARAEGVRFVDLNGTVARSYKTAGNAKVRAASFFATDHTHTTPPGSDSAPDVQSKNAAHCRPRSSPAFSCRRWR